MFGKNPRISPLETRKQLLISRSELHRGQLSVEWQAMALGAHELAHRAKTIGVWASAGALLIGAVKQWQGGAPAPGHSKHSWLQRILKGARLATTVWFAFRALGHKE